MAGIQELFGCTEGSDCKVGLQTHHNTFVVAEDNAIHFRGIATEDNDSILRASAERTTKHVAYGLQRQVTVPVEWDDGLSEFQ